jgi:hypothetical protein
LREEIFGDGRVIVMKPRTKMGGPQTGRYKGVIAGLLTGGLLLAGLLFLTRPPATAVPAAASGEQTLEMYEQEEGPLEIAKGTSNTVPYLYCSMHSKAAHDYVLLHGTAFTKETWKKAGILQALCQDASVRSVTALDFDIHGSSHLLKQTLAELSKTTTDGGNEMLRLPVATIVTPSAGGNPIIDWVAQGQTETRILKYTRSWIPIASNGVRDASRLDKSSWVDVKEAGLPILAIHGSKDEGGRKSMTFLRDNAGATLLELTGGHPCYLDSPDAFVESIVKFVNDLPA